MINYFRKKSENFYLFHKYPITKQFVKFCLVGSTNMVIDISVYWFLTRVFNIYYILAAFLSFVLAVTWSFFINRRWTFRHGGKDTTSQYVKFFAVNTVVMILNLSFLFILVDWLDLYDLAVKLLAAIVFSLVNFSFNKLWTFRARSL
ncbi:MAG: GtrA family protein [Candidatus Buchananbacteria bacterium]|nr:GtrA family protein [Candidatus Buchananbacteria bacterium]